MITSIQNPKVKQWLKYRNKKYRNQYQAMIIEEEHLIEESIKNHLLQTLIVLEDETVAFQFSEIIYVSKEVMKKLSVNTSLNRMIGICRLPKNNIECNRILLLDNIQNPGNMGTILRSAYSFGFKKIYLSKNCVDIFNEKTIQASQGAIFYLDVEEIDLLTFVRNASFPIYATGFENSIELKEVEHSEKIGFIFGNEGSGISNELMKAAKNIVKIKMNAFDSLNVAIAASICMYHFQE